MEDLFKQLGLNSKESSAFMELVKLGACPVSKWSRYSNINRSSMYVLLERLKKEGLIKTFTHRGILHVQAIPMAELPALLYDKKLEIEQSRELLLQKMPELQKLEKTRGIIPKVQFYEGRIRVESMYDEVLKEKKFKAFFHPGRVKTIMPKYFHKIPETLRSNGGSAQELLINCKEAEEYKRLYQSAKHQITILPKTISFSSDTIITKQKIYLISYSERDIVGTEIWNEELAHTQSVLFDLVWNSIKLQ